MTRPKPAKRKRLWMGMTRAQLVWEAMTSAEFNAMKAQEHADLARRWAAHAIELQAGRTDEASPPREG